MPYDQKQLDDLYLRAKQVLGSEATQTLVSTKQRGQAFSVALDKAIKAMGSPDKVTDEQILGALQIAHEVFPVQLEVMSRIYSQPTSETPKSKPTEDADDNPWSEEYRPLDEQDEWNQEATEEAEMAELRDQLEEARVRIRDAFQMQERFLTNVSHELKTPIAVVLTEAQTLRSVGMSAEVMEFVESTEEEMQRLGRLVESFLTLARVRDGHHEPRGKR